MSLFQSRKKGFGKAQYLSEVTKLLAELALDTRAGGTDVVSVKSFLNDFVCCGAIIFKKKKERKKIFKH